MTRSSWKTPHIKLKLEDQITRQSNKRKQFKNQISKQ